MAELFERFTPEFRGSDTHNLSYPNKIDTFGALFTVKTHWGYRMPGISKLSVKMAPETPIIFWLTVINLSSYFLFIERIFSDGPRNIISIHV